MTARYDLAVTHGAVVLEDGTAEKTVGILNGKIAALLDAGEEYAADRVLDAHGAYVMPGAIDTHTHFFEPGAEYREDFAHGTRAAASGGFTCVMEMPNSDPAATDRESFLLKAGRAEKTSVVDYALWGGSTADNQDKLLELKNLGCVAFKAFTLEAGPSFPYLNLEQQFESMKRIRRLNRVFGFHAEDPVIIQEMRRRYADKPWTLELHEQARPYQAELAAINQIILFSRETGCPVHICHLSIPEGARLIAQAKREGVNITAESCAHYFVLNSPDCRRFGTYALIQPPLRSREQMERMWSYLFDGTIDYLGTDHAPYTEEDKEPADGNGWNVIGGAPSIDVAFPLMFDEAVLKRGMSPVQFAKLSATNAAKRFGLYPQKGSIRIGADADLALLMPNEAWTVDRSRSFSKTKVTRFPYQGRRINCKVKATVVRGTIVFQDEKILVQEGYGRMAVVSESKEKSGEQT